MEDYDKRIAEFEELLQRLATEITSGVLFERLSPSELWERAERSVMALRSLSEKLVETMLILKPERTPTIERQFRAILQPLNSFREILFKKTEDPLASSKQALEHLRKALMEGSDLLQLAKSIRKEPSKSIMEILKLREVYQAKEYLSTLPVPETLYLRFVNLRRQMENLTFHMANLEKALEDVRASLDIVQNEISKFRPASAGEAGGKESEPTLLRREKQSKLEF